MKKLEIVNRRRTVGERIVFVLIWIWFMLYSLSMIAVLIWAFLSSLKSNREFFSAPFSLPSKWLLSNYIEAVKILKYKNIGFLGMIWNSLWMTLAGTIIGTFTSAACGYVFAKYDFPLKKAMLSFNVFVITIPLLGGGAAGYKLIYDLQLDNSVWYIVVNGISMCFGMNLIIWKAAFSNQSLSMAEAAELDGAGNWTIFLKIAMPTIVPIFVALSITNFIAGWNDYMTTFMYMDNYPTLAAGLYFYREELKYASNEPLYFAGAVISIVPPVLVFAFMQTKVFGQLNLGGGLKG